MPSRIQPELVQLAELAIKFKTDPEPLLKVASRYPFRLTSSYASLIQEPGDPIWRQCVPSIEELADDESLQPDPLAEELLSPVPGLIHRYPDRVVLLVSNHCSTYCRFCMRKRRVGRCGTDPLISRFDLDQSIEYIGSRPWIKDVLLSGGDPLLLEDETLEHILLKIKEIDHVEIIRIGTRAPVVQPERITLNLCSILKRFQPIYINTHFNHPREINEFSARACSMLADAGVQLGNQTVLLRDVNDRTETLAELFSGLLRIRVRPYYLHQMDLVQGTGHFRTPLAEGIKLSGALRGRISGMAIPHYVVDLPGGKGKVPLTPVNAMFSEDKWIISTKSGETVEYWD